MKRVAQLLIVLSLGLGVHAYAQNKPNADKKIKKKQTEVVTAGKPFVIGAETRQYRYSEPGFVTHEGLLLGLWGEWYWESALGKGKAYGNLLYGNLNYDGALCDLSNNCTPYQAKTTDWIWKVNSRIEVEVNEKLNLFAGGGFRYLYDRGQGVGFYTRTGNWAYIPLGGFLKYQRFTVELEYDHIIYGSFKSALSEVSTSFSDLVHTQKGYGLLMTLGYRINSSWNIQGIYESWSLDESDVIVSGGSAFVEPQNNSQSFGLKIGYLF